MKLEIVSKSRPTHDSISLLFKKTAALQKYKPGQHGLLSFKIGEEVLKRSYSFHTAPTETDTFGITVREVKNGKVSSYLQNLNGKSEIYLEGIAGDFTVEPSQDVRRHLVMFAGGSGITPIMSMIKSILQIEMKSTISLVYSNKSYSTIIFRSEIEELQQKFPGRINIYHVLTGTDDAPADFPVFYKDRLSKLVTKKLLKAILSEVKYDSEYYLCGPQGFMEVVEEAIRSVATDGVSINKEHFFVPDKPQDFDYSNITDCEVILQMHDQENLLVVPSGKSILQAALESGFKLRYSCTEGQCGTCRALLITGEVKMRKNHILTDGELKEGQILLCQGFPVSDGISIKTSL
jgi:ring-1,2-phenylacetyl-CoA epoxidase subunit PaaE